MPKYKTTVEQHGMRWHPAYRVWADMQSRCRNKNHHAYKNYGARGITVCAQWINFSAFWRDMGPTYVVGKDLDRRNNSRGYTPKNCHWVPRQRNIRNTRVNRKINTPKGRMLLCQAAVISGLSMQAIRYRISVGWPVKNLFDKAYRRGD